MIEYLIMLPLGFLIGYTSGALILEMEGRINSLIGILQFVLWLVLGVVVFV